MRVINMVIDVHTHLMDSVESLLDTAQKFGITKIFLMPYKAIYRTEVMLDNLQVINAYKKYPDKIVPFVTVDPWMKEEGVKQLKELILLGAKGLKLHPLTQGLPAHSELYHPLIEIAEKYRIIVQFHTGSPIYSQPLQVLELALTYTKTKFILAHMGLGMLWLDAIRATKRADNIYLDTAGQRFIPVIKYAIKELSSERILFGSDAPFLSLEVELRKILRLLLPEKDLENILYNNALKLLK
jgi:predicted TIM-barrel fold metal-dependent hydrolase